MPCSNETNMITTFADIFSMGTVLSHTVAWIVGGSKEQERSFVERKAYHENTLPEFKDSGYEGYFHDGIEPLPVVAEQHKRYITRLQPSDDITPKVPEGIERHMLVGRAQDRLRAKDILEKFEQLMKSHSTAPPPRTPTADPGEMLQLPLLPGPIVSSPSAIEPVLPLAAPSPSVGVSQPSSLQVMGHPNIGISQILKFKDDTQKGQPADPEMAQLIDSLKYNLRGRDQFFSIDDSVSMRAYRETIADGFQALAWIAKQLDPSRVELAFSSNPNKIHRARRASQLLRLVQTCPYKGDGHFMKNRLGELIDEQIIPLLPYKIGGRNVKLFARKQVSIFVFTDGDWGPKADSSDACGVERPIKRLIAELKKRRLDRTQVSLHFVMFGDKENGRKHLERLGKVGREDGWYVVAVPIYSFRL